MTSETGGWSEEVAVFGIPVRLEASDEALLAAAASALAAWRGAPREVGARGVRVRLRLGGVRDAAGEPVVTVAGERLLLAGGGAIGEADAGRGEARCTVSPALAAAPRRLAAEVVDTLALFLLTRAGRVPLHAAGVVVGGRAVALCGASGVGKSTLALAARRVGLRVLSDDTVYLQLEPRLRIWGFPRPIHLLADSPYLGGEGGPAALRRGRWKVAIPPAAGDAGWPVAERGAVCLLERGERTALREIGVEEAVAGVMAALEPGFDHFRAATPAAVRALAAGGAWRLTLSPDPAAGVAALVEAG